MKNDEGIVCDVTTAYEHYQVIDTMYGGRQSRILYSDNHFAAQSGLALDDQPDLLFDYIQRLFELVSGLQPPRLLMIGGGAFTLPAAILQHLPNIILDIVELDGELLDIATTYFNFKPSANTQVHAMDGRDFLAQATGPYDMIIMDAFIQTTIPPHLQTVEAARQFRGLLSPNGVFAMNIICAYHGRRSAVLSRQVAALQTEFSHLELFPAANNISLWSPQNFVLTACNTNKPIDQYLRYQAVDVPSIPADQAISD